MNNNKKTNCIGAEIIHRKKGENILNFLFQMISYCMREGYNRYLRVLIIKCIKADHNYKWHFKQEDH